MPDNLARQPVRLGSETAGPRGKHRYGVLKQAPNQSEQRSSNVSVPLHLGEWEGGIIQSLRTRLWQKIVICT